MPQRCSSSSFLLSCVEIEQAFVRTCVLAYACDNMIMWSATCSQSIGLRIVCIDVPRPNKLLRSIMFAGISLFASCLCAETSHACAAGTPTFARQEPCSRPPQPQRLCQHKGTDHLCVANRWVHQSSWSARRRREKPGWRWGCDFDREKHSPFFFSRRSFGVRL